MHDSHLLEIVALSDHFESDGRLFAMLVVEGRQLYGHIVSGCDVLILLERMVAHSSCSSVHLR